MMRYIKSYKVFESIDFENKEISTSEFHELIKKREIFSKKETDILTKIPKDVGIYTDAKCTYEFGIVPPSKFSIKRFFKGDDYDVDSIKYKIGQYRTVHLYKLPDYYYLLSLGYRTGKAHRSYYMKCDDILGAKKMIDDLMDLNKKPPVSTL